MTTLYTNGDFINLTPAQFAVYTLIRYSADNAFAEVHLGLAASGTVNFATKLGTVSAEILGWTGADNITTGSGADSLWGYDGNDVLSGGAGDDLLVGDWDDGLSIGNDTLYGGDGNDALIGGAGNDQLFGGNGDDLFSFGGARIGNVAITGGAGVDEVSVSDLFGSGIDIVAFSRLVLNPAASVEYFVADSITLTGTAGNDVLDLSGTAAYRNGNFDITDFAMDLLGGADSFLGGASNEQVTVTGGHDQVSLGLGDDILTLRDGVMSGDTLSGGLGHDRLILGNETAQG